MKPMLMLLIGMFVLTVADLSAANIIRTDSIGVKVVDGKSFIQHKVDPGESLSVIARRYRVGVAEIQKSNKMLSTSLKAGDVILVPLVAPPKGSSDPKPVAQPKPAPASKERVVHTVNKGETLFAIAKKYGTSVEQIKSLNRMDNDALSVGQELVIQDKGERVAAVAPVKTTPVKTTPVKVSDPVQPESHPSADSRPVKAGTINTPSSEHNTGSLIDMMSGMSKEDQDSALKNNVFPDAEVLTTEKVAELSPTAKRKAYTDPYSGKKYEQVEENGTAAFIDDFSTDQSRFYAFHKYLPVGSYIRIDYPAKNQSILVEVISNLDKKDPNVVRISAKCGHYLSLWKEGEKVKLRYVVPALE